MGFFAILFFLELTFTADCQHAVFDVLFDILFCDFRQLDLDHIFLLVLHHVNERSPIGKCEPAFAIAAKRFSKDARKPVLEKRFRISPPA